METRISTNFRYPGPRTWLIVLITLQLLIIMPQASDEAGAATWSSPYIVASGSVLASMSMDVDGDWIYCVYVQDNRGIPSVVMRFHDGSAWSSMRMVSDPLSTSAVDPAVSVSNGVAHIVWMDRTDGDQDVFYRTFNGTDFGPHVQVSSIMRGVDDTNPDVAADGTYVHVVWESLTATDRDISYRYASAGRFGSIFAVSTDVDDDLQVNPAVAADGAKAHVVWEDLKPGDRNIFYRKWTGSSWETERDLQGGNDRTVQLAPDVAVDGDNVYVVFTDYTNPLTPSISSVMYIGGRWGGAMDVPGPTGSENNPEIDVEAGHVALVYTNSVTTGSAYFQHFDRHSWGTPEAIETGTAQSFSTPTSVVLQHGRVHVTVLDQGQTSRVHRYYTGEVDEAGPSAEVGEVTPFWMDLDRISIPYTATDDYGLESVTFQYRYSTDKVTWGRWTEVTTLEEVWNLTTSGTFSFQAADGEGFYEFKAYARDIAGKAEAPSIDPEAEAAMDRTPPVASVLINDGDDYALNSSVILDINYSDAMTDANRTSGPSEYLVELSNDGRTWTEVTVRGNKHAWDLASGEGFRTVHLRVTDAAGLVSTVAVDSIEVDLADPYGTITMTVTGEWTTTRDVTLELTHGDTGSGVSMVRFADEAVGGDEPWEDPVDTKQWTLPEGEGTHTVAYQVLDVAGRTSEVYTASIGLDTVAPTGSIIIGGLDSIVTERTVTLVLTSTDATSGVAGIRVGNEEFVGGDEPWDNQVDTMDWELTEGSGLKTVYYQVIDVAGLTSEIYTATILLDVDVPTGAIALSNGATMVNTATVELALSYADVTSTIVGIRIQEVAVGGDEPWENPVETLEFTLSTGDGEKTIYFQVLDEAGQESQVYSITITLDTTNPTVVQVDPTALAEKIPLDKVISVRFSETMDADSVERAFTLSFLDDGVPNNVGGTFNWSPDGKTVTFTPLGDLKKGTQHSIAISDSAEDAAGNTLFPPLVSTFKTAGDDGGDGGDGDGDGLDLGSMLLILIVAFVLIGALVVASMYYFVKMERKKEDE
jgi:hypothetical protein